MVADDSKRLVLAGCALALLLTACASVAPEPSPVTPQLPTAQPAERSAPPTRRSPFTEPPGAFFADVKQGNVAETICVPGWTATVRPSTSFTQGLKKVMLARAGLPAADAVKYELDHFVPLAVGGHPSSEDNLWLQRWDGAWNARVKDRLERRLKVMVCAGEITLHTARTAIQHDWHAAYRKYVAADPSIAPREIALEEEEVVNERRSEQWRVRNSLDRKDLDRRNWRLTRVVLRCPPFLSENQRSCPMSRQL